MSSTTLTVVQMPGYGEAESPVGMDSFSHPQDGADGDSKPAPFSLRQALRSAQGVGASTPTDSTSEEDYDEDTKKPVAVLLRRSKEKERPGLQGSLPRSGSSLKIATASGEPLTPSDVSSEADALDAHQMASLKGAKLYTVASDDKELREILKRGMLRVSCHVVFVVSGHE